ncbi:uncharacterized protein LOC117123005 [Anneissia japonica]|uniref:uncharacterized protein LOC117123005 n=1 Tax=Anneissia japonica TaxID=1529436 RepID=UPI0014259209|nr:uncharacterized protein LOC117123005 [Anneissia japonica]
MAIENEIVIRDLVDEEEVEDIEGLKDENFEFEECNENTNEEEESRIACERRKYVFRHKISLGMRICPFNYKHVVKYEEFRNHLISCMNKNDGPLCQYSDEYIIPEFH